MSAYPEHLNPFGEPDKPKKRTLSRSFRNSFRKASKSLSRALVFGNDKKRRQSVSQNENDERNAHPRHTYPAPGGSYSTSRQPVPLPRSRFPERVSHLSPKKEEEPKSGYNPFDDDDDNAPPITKPKYRIRKKRAPLPPGSETGGSTLTLNSDYHSSTLSIDSCTTDASGYTNYSDEPEHAERSEHFNEISELTAEIQRHYQADDTEAKEEASGQPEEREALILEKPKSADDLIGDIQKMRDFINDLVIDDVGITADQVPASETSRVIPEIHIQTVEETDSSIAIVEQTETKEIVVTTESFTMEHPRNEVDEQNTTAQTVISEDENIVKKIAAVNIELNGNAIITSTDEDEQNNNVVTQDEDKRQLRSGFSFVETKDVYIAPAPTQDNGDLVYTERKSIYVTGSSDELNADEPNTTKVRKQKLRMDEALGSNNEIE